MSTGSGSQVLSESDNSESDDDIEPPTIVKRRLTELPGQSRKLKSKYKGVFRCGKKFKAQIQTNGVQHYLGLFDIEEDAARAYDSHARMAFGPRAKTNFEYDRNETLKHAEISNMLIANDKNHIEPMKSQSLKRTYVGIKVRRQNSSLQIERDNFDTGCKNDEVKSTEISLGASYLNNTSFSFNKCWSGDFLYDDSKKSFCWKGGWGTTRNESEIKNSNMFEYECLIMENSKTFEVSGLLPVSGLFKGHFTNLQNINAPSRSISETILLHFGEFKNDETGKYSVVGKAENELGKYILQGNYNARTKRLTLSRELVLNDDIRLTFDPTQIKAWQELNPYISVEM